jgi:hypothetical protein
VGRTVAENELVLEVPPAPRGTLRADADARVGPRRRSKPAGRGADKTKTGAFDYTGGITAQAVAGARAGLRRTGVDLTAPVGIGQVSDSPLRLPAAAPAGGGGEGLDDSLDVLELL